MARGWESKSVEQQIEESRSQLGSVAGIANPPEELEMRRRLESLDLQRSSLRQELATARNPRYRKMLEEMLNHIERQLVEITPGSA
jgi:hypothetical protein